MTDIDLPALRASLKASGMSKRARDEAVWIAKGRPAPTFTFTDQQRAWAAREAKIRDDEDWCVDSGKMTPAQARIARDKRRKEIGLGRGQCELLMATVSSSSRGANQIEKAEPALRQHRRPLVKSDTQSGSVNR